MNWNFFLEALLRSTALVAGAEVLFRMSKRQSPAFRHRLVLGVFVLLAILPILCAVLPPIAVPVGNHVDTRSASVTVQQVSSKAASRPHSFQFAWLPIVWLAGFTVAFIPVLTGTLSVLRIVRTGRKFHAEALAEALESLGNDGKATPPVLLSDAVSVPLTCGLFRPCIVFPAEAAGWNSFRLQAVLSHERSHIRRHDVAAQVFAHLISALWWFQPAVWILRRRLRSESEMACDTEAIRSGLKPSAYAGELLAVARSLSGDAHVSSLAIGMTRTKSLEARLRALLLPSQIAPNPFRQLALSGSLAAFAVAASAVTPGSTHQFINQGESTMKNIVLSALFASFSLSAATVSGSVNSPAGDAISDAKVLVYNPDTGAKQEATTSADGTFSLSGAGAGQYILRVVKPGFNSTFRMFDLKAESNVNRQITMAAPGAQQPPDSVVPNSDGSEQKPIRVGGSVAQNNLVTKIQPHYPVAAKAAGVQGTVELEIKVTKDGIPAELRVVSSPSDDLSESALEAVRQWRYRPTLLNGSPTEIVSTVIVNYTLAP